MVDIVFLLLGHVQADNLAHDGDQVFLAQDAGLLVIRDIETELAVQFVAADAIEIITIETEEHGVDELAGIVGSSQIAWADTLVDFL